jgi:hypothetical protein
VHTRDDTRSLGDVTIGTVVIEDSPASPALLDVAAGSFSPASRTLSPGNDADYDGPRCQVCDGPCWQWKGTVHGYTCGRCLDAYLDAAAGRAEAKERKEREKRDRKQNQDPPPARPGARHTVAAAAREAPAGTVAGIAVPASGTHERTMKSR